MKYLSKEANFFSVAKITPFFALIPIEVGAEPTALRAYSI